jgi:hypothetical protein
MLSVPGGRVIEDGSYLIVCCGHFWILLILKLFEPEVDILSLSEVEPIIAKFGETGIQRGNTGLSRLPRMILC